MTTKEVIGIIQKIAAPVERRVRLMVSRAVVTLVDDSLRLQGLQVQLLAGEVRDGVERVQQYGFTSRPLPGAEGVFLAAGGSRDHGLVVAVDDRRYRPRVLAEGECALYTHEGVLVRCKQNKVVELGPDPTDAIALAPATKSEIQKVLTYAQGIASAIQAGVPTPQDGGANLKTTIVADLPAPPTLTEPAATKVKAK